MIDIKFACTNLMIPGGSLTEQARLLKSIGFEGIAIFTDYENFSPAFLDEVLNLKSKTDIAPCEFAFSGSLYGNLMSSDPDICKKSRQMYLEAIRVCSQIGAVTEIEYSYGPQKELPLFSPYQKMNHLQEEYFLKMYQEFLNEVEGTNGHILIEGINRYESPYMNNLADCADVVKKINHPNAGVLADFFHMSIEEVNLPQSILDCGHLIRHVHLGDSNRLLPGNGNTDWKGCFEALKQIGYSGYLNLECAIQGPFTKVEQSLNYMKRIIEG